jgi:hypothetical protein
MCPPTIKSRFWLTNSIQLSPCWEATSRSDAYFTAFHGTQRFITVFTRALHWSISWARSIQSIPRYPISLRSILILSPYLRLRVPSGLFLSGSPTKINVTWVRKPKEQSQNRRSLLGNDSVNTFPRQWIRKQQSSKLLCNSAVNTPSQQQRGCVFCEARAKWL